MNKQRGFSIIEFAIVLMIIGLLVGGIMGTGAWKHWMQRAEELDQRQRGGYDEFAYQMKTGKPCPTSQYAWDSVPAGYQDLLELCPPVE